MQNLTEETRKILKETGGFIENNNYEVLEVKENYCKLKGIISETSLNNLKICHGGYIFGLADTAGGIAAMTDYRLCVTLNSNINFIKQAKGEYLIAEAKKISVGKNTSVFEVYVKDYEEELVAKATITYYYLKNATTK